MSSFITTTQGLVTRTRRIAAATTKRLARETGQTAAEYMGVLLVIAVMIGALANTDIGGHIGGAIGGQIDKITKADEGVAKPAAKGNGGKQAKPAGKAGSKGNKG